MKYLKNEKGLTLLETVIAFAAVITLVTAFTGALIVGMQSEEEMDQLDIASSMASTIIEFYDGEVADVEEWDNQETYSKGDILYDDDKIYISRSNNNNAAPNPGDNWLKIEEDPAIEIEDYESFFNDIYN